MPAKKLIPDKRKRGKAKAGGGTIKAKTHLAKRKADDGHADRLLTYVKRTLQLKRDGYYLQEIAYKIAEEFNLETVPHITTIAKWREHGNEAFKEDIKQLQGQLRIDQFNELESMKAKWLPIAIAGNLEITRWVRIEGELQPELDERAIEEQLKATREVVNIMNRQAKLLGLDLEKSVNEETGEGPGSLQDLQIWLINQVNISTGAPNGAPIDVQAEVLELRSGIEEENEV